MLDGESYKCQTVKLVGSVVWVLYILSDILSAVPLITGEKTTKFIKCNLFLLPPGFHYF